MIPLSGTGTIGSLLFSPTSLTFPKTVSGSQSGVQTAVLTNELATSMPLGVVTMTGRFTQTNDCPATLAPGGICTFSVTFAPVSTGAAEGSMLVNSGNNDAYSLYLSGQATGSGGATVDVSPNPYHFPDQAINTPSAPVSIGVTNNTPSSIVISSISTSTPYTATNGCLPTLSPGLTCYISVTFSPTTLGSFSGSLSINYAGNNSPQTVALSGNGAVPVTVIPKSGGFYFYHQIVNTPSTPQPVTITNNQSVPLSISSMTTSAEYPFTTDCVDSSGTGTLAPKATCTVEISFLPQSASTKLSSLVVKTSAAGNPF